MTGVFSTRIKPGASDMLGKPSTNWATHSAPIVIFKCYFYMHTFHEAFRFLSFLQGCLVFCYLFVCFSRQDFSVWPELFWKVFWRPGWLWPPREPPASASLVLELKVCVTHSLFYFLLLSFYFFHVYTHLYTHTCTLQARTHTHTQGVFCYSSLNVLKLLYIEDFCSF